MFNYIKRFLLAAFLSLSQFSPLFSATIDKALIGQWQGERDDEGKCFFLAWKMTRFSDGTFNLIFFDDKNKSRKIGQQSGIWWIEKNLFNIKTNGVPTTNVFTYNLINQDAVRFSNLIRDPSADCQTDDYQFTETRILYK